MKPFSQWVAENRCIKHDPFLWQCTENYYIKALIGYPSAGADGIGQPELELAKNILRKFDIVLITELLNHPNTEKFLHRQLSFRSPIPNLRFQQPPRPAATDAELFDAPTLEWLAEANRLDSELYLDTCDLFWRRVNHRNIWH
jgi:hypothetical protein